MAKDIPLWVAVVIGLGPSVVAVVALVAAELRDRRRLAHEREMQLNNERRQAYATFAQRTSEVYDIDNLQAVPQLREAHAMVEILSESPALLETAASLVRMWRGAWLSAHNAREAGAPDPFDIQKFKSQANVVLGLRATFIDRAREELGVNEGEALEPPGGTSELSG